MVCKVVKKFTVMLKNVVKYEKEVKFSCTNLIHHVEKFATK